MQSVAGPVDRNTGSSPGMREASRVAICDVLQAPTPDLVPSVSGWPVSNATREWRIPPRR